MKMHIGSSILSGLLLLIPATLAQTAAWAPGAAVTLWTAQDQWVRLERQDDRSAPPNDHPVVLSPEAVANVLGALRIQDPEAGTGPQAVFAREELTNLAPQISAGLARAGPRQDVTFATIGSHPLGGSAGSLIKDPAVNAGRVFFAGGKLHVIFGELHANYRKRNVYGRRDQDFEPRRQGTRKRVSEQKWTLASAPGVELHASGDGSVRQDWVTIDTAVDRAPVAPAVEPQVPSPTASAAAGESAPAPADPQPQSAAPPQSGSDLERRLQVLKELREKGLISEDAYEMRVRELLSEL